MREQAGEFALVRADEWEVFPTWDDAIRAGYRRFGLEPFMVVPTAKEEARFVARMTITRHAPGTPGGCPT